MKGAIAAAALMLLAGSTRAQPSWDNVLKLRTNRTVKVYLRSGEALKGRIESAGAEGLTLRGSGGKLSPLDRRDVLRVTKKSRAKGALWGGLVLFGITAPIGAYAGPYIADWGYPSAGVRFRYAMGFGLFFGGVGAGIGALTGAEATVYRGR